MTPVIGITTSIDKRRMALNYAYSEAILRVGGAAVCLPNDLRGAASVLERLDGVLFSGGDDIHSKHFGQELHEKAELCEQRDEFELPFFKMVRESGKPVFGICRGHQLINVAMGGSLIQHIENHQQKGERHETSHNALILPGTWLFDTLKTDKVPVNTFHHQVADKTGTGLIVSARSDDGYIEALEYAGDDWFCKSVQWHPEAMLENPEETLMLKLFEAFVSAAAR